MLSDNKPETQDDHEIYRFEPYELEETDIHELGIELGADVTGETHSLDPEDETKTYFMSFIY